MRGVTRKGSMQLSIEAIIILVIAMVLLGLGISFIQGFFKQAREKTGEAFDPIQFGCNPDAVDPITVSPSSPELKSGDQLEVKICVYANTDASQGASVKIDSCTSTAGGTEVPLFLSAAQGISRTEIGGFKTILTAKDAADPTTDLSVGTYICTIEATVGAVVLGTEQVTISVT